MSEQELKLLFHTLGYTFYPDWDTEEGGYRNYFAIGKKLTRLSCSVFSS